MKRLMTTLLTGALFASFVASEADAGRRRGSGGRQSNVRRSFHNHNANRFRTNRYQSNHQRGHRFQQFKKRTTGGSRYFGNQYQKRFGNGYQKQFGKGYKNPFGNRYQKQGVTPKKVFGKKYQPAKRFPWIKNQRPRPAVTMPHSTVRPRPAVTMPHNTVRPRPSVTMPHATARPRPFHITPHWTPRPRPAVTMPHATAGSRPAVTMPHATAGGRVMPNRVPVHPRDYAKRRAQYQR